VFCQVGWELGRAEPGSGEDGAVQRDLRHTAVALWIAAGASPKEVAARAGHTSVSFVLDRYGHLFPESDAALRDHLDLLFRGSTKSGT
jgi:integrase